METFTIDKAEVAPVLTSLQIHGAAILAGDETARLSAIADADGRYSDNSVGRGLLTATRTCIDIRLFENLSNGKGTPMDVKELAKLCEFEPSLLSRFLKHLTSMQVIDEAAADTCSPTALSDALTIPRYRDAIPFCSEVAGPIFQKLPTFLANTKYTDPNDNKAGPFQYGHDTTLMSIEWRKQRPNIQSTFNNHMAGYHTGRPTWMDPGFYPVQERVVAGFKANGSDVFIVDIGGNTGYDLQELHAKHSSLPGKLVLQDLPRVIHGPAKGSKEGIEAMRHDAFTPPAGQSFEIGFVTVQLTCPGARSYFMHSVLHDWRDFDCQRIRDRLKGAMKVGYSKLLVYENIVPDRHASWQMTSLDLFMMVFVAARELTETAWRKMLEEAGFKVTWYLDGGSEI